MKISFKLKSNNKKGGFSLVENIISLVIFVIVFTGIASSFFAYIKMSEESNRLQLAEILVAEVCDKLSRNELAFSQDNINVQYKPSQIPNSGNVLGISEIFKKPEFRAYDDILVVNINKGINNVGSSSYNTKMSLYKVYVYEKLDQSGTRRKLLFQNQVITK